MDYPTVPENEFSLDRLYSWMPGQSGVLQVQEVMGAFVYDEHMARHIASLDGVLGVVIIDPEPEMDEERIVRQLARQFQVEESDMKNKITVFRNPKGHEMIMVNVRFSLGVTELEADVFLSVNEAILKYCEDRFAETQHEHVAGYELPESANPNVVKNNRSNLMRPTSRILRPN